MSAINLQFVEAFWKFVLICVTFPIFSRIEVSTSMCSSGVLENYSEAWTEMKSNQTLVVMMAFAGAMFGMAAVLGVWIIKF
jgi:hypothetical protein